MNREEVLLKSKELVNQIYEKMSVIESCDAIAQRIKDMDVCFNDQDNKQIVSLDGVLSMEQLSIIRKDVIERIYKNATEAQLYLESLDRKPATINPEFEAAVQGMIDSTKDKSKPEISTYVDKPDPVEQKLGEILKEEAKKIESEPVPKSLSDDDIDDVRRMYQTEGKSMKEIAEHYGVTKSVMNNFIYNKKLARTKVKEDEFLDSKVQARQGKK